MNLFQRCKRLQHKESKLEVANDELISAWLGGRQFKSGDLITDGERVYLHGLLIAAKVPNDSNCFFITTNCPISIKYVRDKLEHSLLYHPDRHVTIFPYIVANPNDKTIDIDGLILADLGLLYGLQRIVVCCEPEYKENYNFDYTFKMFNKWVEMMKHFKVSSCVDFFINSEIFCKNNEKKPPFTLPSLHFLFYQNQYGDRAFTYFLTSNNWKTIKYVRDSFVAQFILNNCDDLIRILIDWKNRLCESFIMTTLIALAARFVSMETIISTYRSFSLYPGIDWDNFFDNLNSFPSFSSNYHFTIFLTQRAIKKITDENEK